MKTSELQDALLDYWVARAEVDAGYYTFDDKNPSKALIQLWEPALAGHVFSAGAVRYPGTKGEHIARGASYGEFKPSTRWDFGGPIIEREKLELTPLYDMRNRFVYWSSQPPGMGHLAMEDEAPLVAAMRAYVASKFGGTVSEDQPSPQPAGSPVNTNQEQK